MLMPIIVSLLKSLLNDDDKRTTMASANKVHLRETVHDDYPSLSKLVIPLNWKKKPRDGLNVAIQLFAAEAAR